MTQIKAFHIDNGRKYFSPADIKDLIDVMADNGYNMLELSVGNDGYRILLDDMTISTEFGAYVSEEVKRAVNTGNKKFCDNGTNELTESEVVDIILYARERGIDTMPLLNSPGHMDTLLTAMEVLGISNPAYKTSVTTVDLDNKEAVAFTKAFLRKLITWFSEHGCTYCNLGSDEYANDALKSGFAALQAEGNYGKFISYINDIVVMIKNVGMIPVMFNDGVYYNKETNAGSLDSDIIVSYWCPGWAAYDLAPASFVREMGHKIIDTNMNWYYVLGRTSEEGVQRSFTFQTAMDAMRQEVVPGNITTNDGMTLGAMFCLWTDEPEVPYDDVERERMHQLLKAFKPNV